jgi:hypothetical protein
MPIVIEKRTLPFTYIGKTAPGGIRVWSDDRKKCTAIEVGVLQNNHLFVCDKCQNIFFYTPYKYGVDWNRKDLYKMKCPFCTKAKG